MWKRENIGFERLRNRVCWKKFMIGKSRKFFKNILFEFNKFQEVIDEMKI